MKYIVLVVLSLLLVTGCTDAQRGKVMSLGSSATVECWSGGQLIYKGVSSGKVSSEANSDGYFFKDESDGKFKEVSGNCVITYR